MVWLADPTRWFTMFFDGTRQVIDKSRLRSRKANAAQTTVRRGDAGTRHALLSAVRSRSVCALPLSRTPACGRSKVACSCSPAQRTGRFRGRGSRHSLRAWPINPTRRRRSPCSRCRCASPPTVAARDGRPSSGRVLGMPKLTDRVATSTQVAVVDKLKRPTQHLAHDHRVARRDRRKVPMPQTKETVCIVVAGAVDTEVVH
jgi:hypothetical protein